MRLIDADAIKYTKERVTAYPAHVLQKKPMQIFTAGISKKRRTKIMRCCDCEFRSLCDETETVLTAFVSCDKRNMLLAANTVVNDDGRTFVCGDLSILSLAIQHFGREAQERMMFEEMSELQKAICKLSRGKGSVDDIAQEIADVEIMLEQMKILYDCYESAAIWKLEKLEQLKKLLDEGMHDNE